MLRLRHCVGFIRVVELWLMQIVYAKSSGTELQTSNLKPHAPNHKNARINFIQQICLISRAWRKPSLQSSRYPYFHSFFFTDKGPSVEHLAILSC